MNQLQKYIQAAGGSSRVAKAICKSRVRVWSIGREGFSYKAEAGQTDEIEHLRNLIKMENKVRRARGEECEPLPTYNEIVQASRALKGAV